MLIYTSVIGVILHPKVYKMCIKGVLGVLKVYFKRCCIAPRQKVLNRCKLKMYYKNGV